MISLSEETPNLFSLCHLEEVTGQENPRGQDFGFSQTLSHLSQTLGDKPGRDGAFLLQPFPNLLCWGLSLSAVTHPCLTPFPAGGKGVKGVPDPLTLSPHRPQPLSSLQRDPWQEEEEEKTVPSPLRKWEEASPQHPGKGSSHPCLGGTPGSSAAGRTQPCATEGSGQRGWGQAGDSMSFQSRRAQLLLVNSLTFGLEVCLAAGITYVPPLLLEVGVEEKFMTMVLGRQLFCHLVEGFFGCGVLVFFLNLTVWRVGVSKGP